MIIALIVFALTFLFALTSSYDNESDYTALVVYILTMVLCAIIIINRGAVHWVFKIAVLIPFFLYYLLAMLAICISYPGLCS